MMRVGVIGDVHLDEAALDRALAGPLAGCDRFVVTGDVLDRGLGEPRAVLERVLALPGVVVLVGNHELAYLGGPVYGGMVEERCLPLAGWLRDLVIDGRLRAAASVGGMLMVHGGVSRAYWRRHLEAECGSDPRQVAGMLNRQLVRAVVARRFDGPVFAALESDVPGPFWASIRDDLLAGGLPPFDQVVGHVAMDDETWHSDGSGRRVYSVCREREREGAGEVGCVVVEA